MFTGDKDWLFTLFLCYFHFGEQMGGLLIVNFSTGAHLSVASGNAKGVWLMMFNLEPLYLLSQSQSLSLSLPPLSPLVIIWLFYI